MTTEVSPLVTSAVTPPVVGAVVAPGSGVGEPSSPVTVEVVDPTASPTVPSRSNGDAVWPPGVAASAAGAHTSPVPTSSAAAAHVPTATRENCFVFTSSPQKIDRERSPRSGRGERRNRPTR